MPNWLRRIWYGRYHATLVRQITNEEHVSITFAEKSKEDFDERLGGMLGVLRDHMIQHNNQIVLRMGSQIKGLMEQIEAKGRELNDLEQKYDKKVIRLEKK